MADPGQALADARLFVADARRAADAVMAGRPPGEAGVAYLAVLALLATAALWPEARPEPCEERQAKRG